MKDAMKLNFKDIAVNSLQKEEESIQRRFAAADKVLNAPSEKRETKKKATSATQQTRKPKGKPGRKKSPEPIVREIFSMPQSDYRLIEKATMRCAQAGTVLYKSQVARLALVALDSLSDKQLEEVMKAFAQREVQRIQ